MPVLLSLQDGTRPFSQPAARSAVALSVRRWRDDCTYVGVNVLAMFALAAFDSSVPGERGFAGRYRVLSTIAEGGMGVVLHAVDMDLGRHVAIKVVREELIEHEGAAERALLEARFAANIRSEHAVKVLDIGRDGQGVPYIVMEYLVGEDLSELLAIHGTLPYETAVDFVLQVCEALAEAHGSGIVHCDLKPGNLFLTTRADGEPVVKVLDFGISKEFRKGVRRSVTNPSDMVGSPHYMAPEQMLAASVDGRADIWSLGAVLYELLTGRPPFSNDTIPGVCAMVLSAEPTAPRQLNPDVPVDLERIVLRCLKKDPAERFDDVGELADALARFGGPTSSDYAVRVSRVIASARQTLPSAEPENASRSSVASVPDLMRPIRRSRPPAGGRRRFGLWWALRHGAVAALAFVTATSIAATIVAGRSSTGGVVLPAFGVSSLAQSSKSLPEVTQRSWIVDGSDASSGRSRASERDARAAPTPVHAVAVRTPVRVRAHRGLRPAPRAAPFVEPVSSVATGSKAGVLGVGGGRSGSTTEPARNAAASHPARPGSLQGGSASTARTGEPHSDHRPSDVNAWDRSEFGGRY
ncbi:MAG TPA: serine/threonine-protein kinase [Polyangiaceae bacterium]